MRVEGPKTRLSEDFLFNKDGDGQVAEFRRKLTWHQPIINVVNFKTEQLDLS
jgi:hypothetical protein